MLKNLAVCTLAVVSGGLLVTNASAAIVADYSSDFPTMAAPAKKVGWNYLTNNNGPMGIASGYIDLFWSSFNGGSFKTDPDNALSDPSPVFGDGAVAGDTTYLYMTASGGHPGLGTAQQTGPTETDRFAIAAYTLQTGGPTTISNSIYTQIGSSQELVVYVNNTYITGSTTSPFVYDLDLGTLSAGDTIYVAVGPNTDHGSDGFAIDFTINQVPEPTGLAILSLGGLLMRRRRDNA